VGPRDGLATVLKRKYPCLCRELSPFRPVRSLVSVLTEWARYTPWGCSDVISNRTLYDCVV